MKEKKINILQKVTGFSKNTIPLLEDAIRKKITLLGSIMIFTALISAIVMSYAISALCFNRIWMMPLIFIIWFIFVYFFERLIIAGSNIKGSSVLYYRIAAVICFAIIHSLIIDTLFFQKDINSSYNKDKTEKQKIIEDKFDEKIQDRQNQISVLSNQNQKLFEKIYLLKNKLTAEADGTDGTKKFGMGPIFELKQNLYQPEIKSIQDQIKHNNETTDKINKEIAEIKTEKNIKINKVPSSSDQGLLSNIRRLHQIEFINGDFISRSFGILWFLIFVFIESLPLIGKLTLDIDSYYGTQNLVNDGRQQLATVEVQQNVQKSMASILLLAQNNKIEAKGKLLIEKMQISNNFFREQIIQNEQILESIISGEKKLNEKFENHRDSQIRPLFKKLEKELQILINNINFVEA